MAHHKRKSAQSIIKIIAAGAPVTFDGSHKTSDDLVLIAAAAQRAQVKITIKNISHKATYNLVRIAEAGGGFVMIEL